MANVDPTSERQQLLASLQPPALPPHVAEASIVTLGLSTRALNALTTYVWRIRPGTVGKLLFVNGRGKSSAAHQLKLTIGELVQIPVRDLLRTPNIGKRTIAEIYTAIHVACAQPPPTRRRRPPDRRFATALKVAKREEVMTEDDPLKTLLAKTPKVTITIRDWRMAGKLLTDAGLPYTHGQIIEGVVMLEALRIARECFAKGLNVMLLHGEHPEEITLAVDTLRFQQR